MYDMGIWAVNPTMDLPLRFVDAKPHSPLV